MTANNIKLSAMPYRSLQRALRGNGIFSGLSGLLFLGANRPLADFIGIPWAMVIAGIGVVLLMYTATLFYTAHQPSLSLKFGPVAVLLDGLWVVGTIILLVGGWLPLTTVGIWTLIILGDIVLFFALWQGYALWKLK